MVRLRSRCAAIALICVGISIDRVQTASAQTCEVGDTCTATEWLMRDRPACSLIVTAGSEESQGVASSPPPPPHEISCAHAVFAPIVTTSFEAPIKQAPALNFDLCKELPKGYAKGFVLVAERGVCPMLSKVEVASKAGAVGVVMVQSDEGLPSRMISHKLPRKEVARVIKIPAVMISRDDAEHLFALTASSGSDSGTSTANVTFLSSFDAADPIADEARSWDQIRTAKGSAAKAAAYRVLGWKMARAGWKDDSARMAKASERLLLKLPPWEIPTGMEAVLEATAEMDEEGVDIHAGSDALFNGGGRDKIEMITLLSKLYPRVCEIGFHRGLTGLALLDGANSNTTTYTGFEFSDTEVSHVAAGVISRLYGDRFEMVWGNSQITVPKEAQSGRVCDLMIVDGSRMPEEATADLLNFRDLAADEHMVVMNDSPCVSKWCQGPGFAWAGGEHNGTVLSYHRAYFSAPEGTPRAHGFSIGAFPRTTPTEIITSQVKGMSYADMGMAAPPPPPDSFEAGEIEGLV